MDDNRVWKKETTELLVEIISEAVKPKVPVLFRGLVKPAVNIAVKTLNSKASKFVPDIIDNLINDAIVAGVDGDWDEASVNIGAAADVLIDVPTLPDEYEKQLFVSITAAIIQSIKYWIEKKKA